jgi:hypothetical protein
MADLNYAAMAQRALSLANPPTRPQYDQYAALAPRAGPASPYPVPQGIPAARAFADVLPMPAIAQAPIGLGQQSAPVTPPFPPAMPTSSPTFPQGPGSPRPYPIPSPPPGVYPKRTESAVTPTRMPDQGVPWFLR